MPYIKRSERHLARTAPRTPGELNYAITRLIKEYFARAGGYQSINDVLGALEGAKLEFYRRRAVPYEDEKMKENGDVYN